MIIKLAMSLIISLRFETYLHQLVFFKICLKRTETYRNLITFKRKYPGHSTKTAFIAQQYKTGTTKVISR